MMVNIVPLRAAWAMVSSFDASVARLARRLFVGSKGAKQVLQVPTLRGSPGQLIHAVRDGLASPHDGQARY
jgi:hypothetical protein